MSGTAPQSPTPSALPEAALPPAVQRQRDRANALMMEQARQSAPAPGPPDAAQGTADPGIQVLVPQQEPTEPPRQPEPPRQEPQAPQPGQADDWEHKYRSLEGRHRADLARQQAQLDGMRDLVATLQNPPAPTTPTAPVETFRAGPDSELSDDERRDYGPDLIGVITKIARQQAYDVAGKLRPDIEKVQQHLGRVTEVATRTAQNSFYEDLDRSVPDWRELNTNAEFLDWLNTRDAYSGVSRMELLNTAVNEKSAARAAAFFEGYKREQTTVSPQGQQPAAPSPAVTPGNGRVPLESLAAPGRAKPGGAGTPQEKPVYTRAQITKFFDDVRRGHFRGREAEMQRTEQDIFAATAEGRIT